METARNWGSLERLRVADKGNQISQKGISFKTGTSMTELVLNLGFPLLMQEAFDTSGVYPKAVMICVSA